MYETDFTFCASYKDGTSTSRELHKCMQYTQAKSHDSKGQMNDKHEISGSNAIISWSEKTALLGVAPLAIPQQLSFEPRYMYVLQVVLVL